MEERKCFYVGFDTSNYTTSMAACDESGNIIANVKMPLPVKEGSRGLRQSDAVFLHVKNFTEMYDRFKLAINGYGELIAVGASDKPRSCEGSYMPCFLVGYTSSLAYAQNAGVPTYTFSHQDGHVMAALYSASHPTTERAAMNIDEIMSSPFAAFHVSGGTTELLYVDPRGDDFKIEKLGGTEDLNAGQAIDRIGVKMGLKFPCGPEMECLALKNTEKIPPRKLSVKGLSCCLSGLENLAEKLYAETESKELVSAFVFEYVAEALGKLTDNLREKYPEIPVIYAGGVMSNKIIQKRLAARENVYFADPQFSADNAAGIALLCRRRHLQNK